MRWVFVLAFFSCALSVWSSNTSVRFSKPYLQRLVLDQKVYLWHIENLVGDEEGYRSLILLRVWNADAIKINITRAGKAMLQADEDSYTFIPDDVCTTISRAVRHMKKYFQDSLRCVVNTLGSYPYAMIIGENNNEIFKEFKSKNLSHKMIIPSWYDYEVKDSANKAIGNHSQ